MMTMNFVSIIQKNITLDLKSSVVTGMTLVECSIVKSYILEFGRLYYQPNLTELAQVSQYLSMTVAPSILKYAICVAILPQFTQNFSLVGSFVKGSIYRRVFNS